MKHPYHYIGVVVVMVGLLMASAEPINPSLSLSLTTALAGLATVGIGILIFIKGDRYENNA